MVVALTAALLAVATITAPAVAGEGDPVDPAPEATNYTKQNERPEAEVTRRPAAHRLLTARSGGWWTRVGLTAHSYGAAGVSWVGQQDHRVDAVVASDNLTDASHKPQTFDRRLAAQPSGCRPPA